MKILVTTALSLELNPIKNKIKKLKLPLKVGFFSTWMWNENIILNLTKLLKEKHYDFIFNIWSCGYISSNYDIIQIAKITNLTNLKEKLPPIQVKLEKLHEVITVPLPLKNIEISHNKNLFYFEKNQIITSNIISQETFIDMESYWFEIVCEKFSIPRIILKIPTDKIWEKFNSQTYLDKIKNIDFEKYLTKIIDFLGSIPNQPNFEKYFEHFKFTFSQKEIFKKLYFKYQALIGNFDNFFEENKNLDRKIFLKKLEETLNS